MARDKYLKTPWSFIISLIIAKSKKGTFCSKEIAKKILWNKFDKYSIDIQRGVYVYLCIC